MTEEQDEGAIPYEKKILLPEHEECLWFDKRWLFVDKPLSVEWQKLCIAVLEPIKGSVVLSYPDTIRSADALLANERLAFTYYARIELWRIVFTVKYDPVQNGLEVDAWVSVDRHRYRQLQDLVIQKRQEALSRKGRKRYEKRSAQAPKSEDLR